MARQRRKKSKSKLYHITMRGIDKKTIFHDVQDRVKLLSSLEEAKRKGKFKIHSICLMDNHFHLVFEEGEDIGRSVQRFAVSYVDYFHKKYGTVGHLFSNRFHSDPIEDEDYLLKCVRYVHQNPLRAGIVEELEDFAWSSYRAYLGTGSGIGSLMTLSRIKGIFGNTDAFVKFHQVEETWITEDRQQWVKWRIEEVLSEEGLTKELDNPSIRDYMILRCLRKLDLKATEIAEYFKVDRRTIYRLKKLV